MTGIPERWVKVDGREQAERGEMQQEQDER